MTGILQLNGRRKPGFIVALAAGALAWSAADGPALARDLRVGDKIPQTALRDLNGKPVSFSGFKNKALWIALFHST